MVPAESPEGYGTSGVPRRLWYQRSPQKAMVPAESPEAYVEESTGEEEFASSGGLT